MLHLPLAFSGKTIYTMDMKIERVSENQIKCTLYRSDFEDRHLTIKDFFGGSDKARKLFADVLREAGDEFDFYTENVPVMIEAIPAARDSLTVIITKVDDPQEAANRFKSRPRPEELLKSLEKILSAMHLDGIFSDDEDSDEDSSEEDSSVSGIFGFRDLQGVKLACAVLKRIFTGDSALYLNPATKHYYLVLKNEPADENFEKVCNSVVEYGIQIGHSSNSESYYKEHYETVFSTGAVDGVLK